MVRHASLGDVPRLVRLAEHEHTLSPWKGELFDAGEAASTMRSFIEGFNRTLFCSDEGYLAGMVQPMSFSSVKWALEFAWYAEDGEGFALLQAFEGWAQRMGARRVIVNDIVSRGRLATVLKERHGYAGLGVSLQKDL